MQIEFPALLVSSKKRSLFVVASESEFGKCTIQSLRNGYFELMDIYDSEGRHYKIDEVASYKPLSPFWYWPVEIVCMVLDCLRLISMLFLSLIWIAGVKI